MPYESYTPPVGYSFEYLAECGSTNDEALRRGPGSIVVSGRQSAGRGRMGRSFSSEEGGLYVSMCAHLPCEASEAPALAALAALAACEAVDERAQIKWPNDIMLTDKKVAGILCEMRDGCLIFGFGVNVENELPPELTEAGRVSAARESILTKLTHRMAEILAAYPENREALMALYAHKCCTLGRMVDVTYRGMPLYGFAFAVDKHGGLMVMTQESRTAVTIYSGEATFA